MVVVVVAVQEEVEEVISQMMAAMLEVHQQLGSSLGVFSEEFVWCVFAVVCVMTKDVTVAVIVAFNVGPGNNTGKNTIKRSSL